MTFIGGLSIMNTIMTTCHFKVVNCVIKQTYYNLPPLKKERILKAIIEEIDGKSYDEISINQIVKSAEISRGSFYQYFDDKWDIFSVVLQGFSEELSKVCINTLTENNGDIFKTAEIIFDYVASTSDSKKYSPAFKTIFSYASTNLEFFKSKDHCDNNLSDQIKGLVNREIFNINDENELDCMLDIIVALLSRQWFEIFVLEKDREETKQYLVKMLLPVKNGFLRR